MNCSVSNDATGPALFGCAPGLLEMASRLNEAPDVPFEDTFFARAYSLSNDGWVMTWATLILTALLELMSMDEVRKVCKREGGRTLYAQGVLCNVVNNAVLGPPLYELVSNRWMSQPFTAAGRVAMVFAVIVGHSIGYYCAHRWMHTRAMYLSLIHISEPTRPY